MRRVKSRLAMASWDKRVEQAWRDEKVVQRIMRKVERGATLNGAVADVVRPNRRSWAYRQLLAFREHGFEGLIDARMPRERRVSSACQELIHVARFANPRVRRQEVEEILERHGIEPMPSASTIKREMRAADAKRRETLGPAMGADGTTVELACAGGELLLAAEAESGGIAALTASVVEAGKEAREVSQGQVPKRDVARRNRRGHFTVRYNRARRRKEGEVIASYLRSAEEKAEGRVPSWPRFVHELPATIDAKLRMLAFSSVMAGTTGWGALRSPDMAALEPLVGYAYMPSTLAKMVSAMAIAGLGPGLLEVMGQQWHKVAQERWGEPGAMAALYVDNHAKEVWSTLFTQAGKVSHRTRVMPCITTTYAHTGAGTPMVLSVQSGAAPLAPRLVKLVESAEAISGGVVRRAVVIDAEGSTFDILAGFSAAERVIVTPLRPSRAPELELSYSPGSYYRPYREKDELRVASCTLLHRSTGRSLELGALLVRRPHRKQETVLLTTGLRLGFNGRDLADLYFGRWPVQENAFKEAVIVGMNRHRGNCGRMVANVAVVTELEQLEQRAKRDFEVREKLVAEGKLLAEVAEDAGKSAERSQSLLATRRRRLDKLVAVDKTSGKGFAQVAVEHQQALARAEENVAVAEEARTAAKKNEEQHATLEARIAKTEARIKQLEPQRTIRQLDVAQDMILTALKLTAAQIIAFAMREYLASMSMTTETFIRRVFSIKGYKNIGREEERIVFYENPRDPQVTAALHDACRRLNERGLQREGRRLHYEVGPPPSPDGGGSVAGWFG